MKIKAQIPTRPDLKTLWRFAQDTLINGLQLHLGAPVLPSMTETERDGLDAQEGMMIKNSTADEVQVYESGAWRQM